MPVELTGVRASWIYQGTQRLLFEVPLLYEQLLNVKYWNKPLPAHNELSNVLDQLLDREAVFTKIFSIGAWGRNPSGVGSQLSCTKRLQAQLPALFARLRIRRLFDAPCGVFTWMRTMPLEDITYVGGDIVRNIIDRLNATESSARRTFIQFDVVKDQFPRVDLWLCRDCFIHLPNEDILAALKNFANSEIEYLLTTSYNFGFVNSDIRTGDWRPLNLRKPPFSLPRPMQSFFDYAYPHHPRRLALWSREQVRLALR